MPIWNLAQFADIEIVLRTIADKQMTELAVMSKSLTPLLNTSKVTKEARKVPDLEMITKALKDKHPSESLPNMQICAKIGEVFSKLAAAHKAYGEAAAGIAELSTELSPLHYTCLLYTSPSPRDATLSRMPSSA